MTAVWDDLNARARGLATHLLGRGLLEQLALSGDPAVLAAQLDRAGYGPGAPSKGLAQGVSAEGLDLAVRRGAAERLATLQRWCGARDPRLTVVLADEDRRSVRALLRGAVAGAPASSRLAGLLPTRDLPVRALEELARQETAAAVATILVVWGHPYGPPLLPEASRAHADLLRMELALSRVFVRLALGAARRCGREMERYVRRVIDLENAMAALTLSGSGSDLAPADCFLDGGCHLPLPAFLAAAEATTRSEASRLLSMAFRGTPFAEAFRRGDEGSAGIELDVLRAWILDLKREARRSPLGPAVLLGYLQRLRAEAIDLRRIAWGAALGVPGGSLASSLVSPT